MDFAHEFGLTPNTVEKDYVLGWILAGISNHRHLGPTWVFKGGTCLKKCYFETFRFSEDLDFTLTESIYLSEQFLTVSFNEIADWVYEAAGIEIPKDTIRFDIYKNTRGNLSVQGRIGYRGPMRRRGDAPRVKLDLTNDEILVLNPALREVHHPYSDRPENGIKTQCYCLEEVFAEKIRALAERERPRDLYDVVHLYRHYESESDRALVMSTLRQKCTFKGIDVPTALILDKQPERGELETEWENMLGHQLPALPPFQQFWQELPAVFDWLHGISEKVARPRIRTTAVQIDESWRPPAMAYAWHASTPLEVIRFAAANHLCVELAYQNTTRLIEPYSLRRTKDGNLLLYAVKRSTGEDRSYRVDRIQRAGVTKMPFVPRYLIELTPAGPISAPLRIRDSTGLPSSMTSRAKTAQARPKGRTLSYGPKYRFRCPACGKQFTRSSFDASLNPHKNKNGYPCPGGIGVYVGESPGYRSK